MVKTVPVRLGDVEVLVETSPVAGPEPTSATSDAAERVLDVFVSARDTIVELAGSMSDVIAQTATRGVRPTSSRWSSGSRSRRRATSSWRARAARRRCA